MSVKALTWAFDQPIAGNEKVVLLALADHANEHGVCWPSISLLMQRAHVGERTVQRAIQSLEDAGFITRERRQRENGGDTSNLYRLMFQKVSQCVSECISVDQRGSGGVNLAPPSVEGGVTQTGGEGVTGDGGEGVTQTAPIRTVRKNRHKEPSNISFDLEFEEFWAAYPKRPNNPKAPAKTKYVNARIRQNVSHETIIKSVTAYAASRVGEDPKYTAQAVTWLNQRRWELEYQPIERMASEDVNALIDLFPWPNQSASDVLAALKSANADIDDLQEAVRKFSLLVKAQKSEGFVPSPISLAAFIKFKWRDMDAYEFCRVGMNNTLAVRPKRKG